jgi:hypothetical protein
LVNLFYWLPCQISSFFIRIQDIINREGIFQNQFNITKKSIKWDSELYYKITEKYLKLYSTKHMIPLEDGMINKDNIKYGYISIKTKKALNIKIDNKEWIAISTNCLKGNIQINDIIEIINKSREINE